MRRGRAHNQALQQPAAAIVVSKSSVSLSAAAAAELGVRRLMKYRFYTKFWYDEDDAALARRLATFFRTAVLSDAVLKPRSLKLAPTRKNLAQLLVPTDGYLIS